MPLLRKLLRSIGSKEPLAWWKEVFGRDFSAVHQFLSPQTGVAATTYPCPDNSTVLFQVRAAAEGYRAFPTDECADDYDDLELEWSDVQAWGVDTAGFNVGLKDTLGLQKSTAHILGGLVHVGKCAHNAKVRHVYACYAPSESEALKAIISLPLNHGIGCILFPERHLAVDELLQARGIGSAPICECFSLENGDLAGGCSQACQSCKSISNSDLSSQMTEGFDSIRKERVVDYVEQESRQEVIEELADGVDKFIAGLRAQLTQKEAELFMCLIHQESDETGSKRLLSMAEIGKRLGGISKQAVHARVKKLEEKHPKVWAHIAKTRKPKKPIPYSGLSPSERRKEGIDESYNYDEG